MLFSSRHRRRADAVAIDDAARSKEQMPDHAGHNFNSNINITLRERLKHFTWAWFTFPMSTGGIAVLLASTPHRFPGLTTIGKVVFVFDLVVFLVLVAAITARFVILPGSLQKSLMHPTEALFVPTAFVALVNILNCIHEYGVPSCGPWLIVAVRVLFWIYVPITFLLAVVQYWCLFTAPPTRLTIQSMTPAWILPIFPVMLSGTLASLISSTQPDDQRLPIIVAGVSFQGLGFTVAFLFSAIYLHRLTKFGLPAPNLRPGMFIAVGPPSFTGLALIGLSKNLPTGYRYFVAHPLAAEILQNMALFSAIFLWSLGFWLFSISLVSVIAGWKKMTFHLVWWALVFPNVGFTINTIDIGRRFGSEGILWVGSAMTIMLVATWLFVLVMHAKAVWCKEIMMPGKDEDKDEYQEDDKKHGVRTPLLQARA